MVLSGAPFIVPSGEHDVDLVAATVIPLIFLTVLLPEIPKDDDPKQKRLRQIQYVMRALTIVAGFTAMVIAFLQLAGDQTTAGTISVLVLLLIASASAILAMASSIVVAIGKFAITAFGVLVLVIAVLFVPGSTIAIGANLISEGGGRKIGGVCVVILGVAILVFMVWFWRWQPSQPGEQSKPQTRQDSSET